MKQVEALGNKWPESTHGRAKGDSTDGANTEDSISSTGFLTTDMFPSRNPGSTCPTPPPSIDLFNYVIDALRLTDQERVFIHDLLNQPSQFDFMTASAPRDAPKWSVLDTEVVTEDIYNASINRSLQTLSSPSHESEITRSGYEYILTTDEGRVDDLHLYGLSQSGEEESKSLHTIMDGNADNDFSPLAL